MRQVEKRGDWIGSLMRGVSRIVNGLRRNLSPIHERVCMSVSRVAAQQGWEDWKSQKTPH
jgi:hypothetical protein